MLDASATRFGTRITNLVPNTTISNGVDNGTPLAARLTLKNSVVSALCCIPMSPPRVPKSDSAAFAHALGAAVRMRRMRLKQTRANLAQRSGMSEAAIVQVEAGDADLDLLQLLAIAEALEIPLRILLQRVERKVRWRGKGGTPARGRKSGKRGQQD